MNVPGKPQEAGSGYPMPEWRLVVPIKHTAHGKSRLAEPGVDRAELALAIAADTILAAVACDAVGEVIVVTDDERIPELVPDHVRFVADPGMGLNAAIAAGMAVAAPGPRAALLGDLPALTPEDLAFALRVGAHVARGVVADAEGTGSTLVTAAAGIEWASKFGSDSFAAHRETGCVALDVPAHSTLRRDVDTMAAFAEAAELGLGVHTSAWHTVPVAS